MTDLFSWFASHIDFTICVFMLLVFISVFLFYLFKICKLKKNYRIVHEKEIKDRSSALKPGAKYIACLCFAFLTVLLPLFIPLETIVIVAACAAGILGEIIVFKDRIESLRI